MQNLYGTRSPVSAAQFDIARRGWRAFTAPDPIATSELLDQDSTALPFLAPALIRLLREFPDWEGGLNRTQRAIMSIVRSGVQDPKAILSASQDREPARFIGDWTLRSRIEELFRGRVPLLHGCVAGFGDAVANGTLCQQTASLTEAGVSVLAGEADQIQLNGIDCWRGGTHLLTNHHWRWRDADQVLVHIDVTCRDG